MSQGLTLFGTVAGMWLIAVAIPGPNAFAVARMATRRGRGEALAAVGGIGLGSLGWGLAGFFGIHALFALAPLLYGTLRLAGAAYLVLLGLRVLAASTRAMPAQAGGPAFGPAFRVGLVTSLSNPKSTLLVGSLFAALLPGRAPLGLGLEVVGEMVAISLAWYSALACLLSAAPVALAFARAGRWIDRLAGAVFIGFGARLMLESR
ncbi:MAG: LysE family transporter [Rhodospirillales bacterium]|nr:LysE family transporter [Rhodospirillales bacterium]MDE2574817.1 LysE family transporter [Rhodospirillales bacterium]